MPSRASKTAHCATVAGLRDSEQRSSSLTKPGVRLNRAHVGALPTGSGKSLTVDVGQRVQGNVAQVELSSHRQVEVVFGPNDQKVTVASSYSFPASA